LSTLKLHTNQSKDLLHAKSKGFIYAMIHLRTNKFFVIATQKNLRASFKQHWYSAHLRNTKFHRILSKGKLRDVMIWPLEKLKTINIDQLTERKKFWIKTLQFSKKWVKKSSSGNTTVISEQPASLIHQQMSQQSVRILTTGSPTVNTMSIQSQLCQDSNKTISSQSCSSFSHASLIHFLHEQYSKKDSKATKEQRDFLYKDFLRTFGKPPPTISSQTPIATVSETKCCQPYTPSQTSNIQEKHVQGKACANITADQADNSSKFYNPHRPETQIQTCQETIPSIALSVKQLETQNEKIKLSQDLFKEQSNK
jgi:hypothetical protein